MTDRFSKATFELEEKNAFACESCDDLYGHGKKDREERDLNIDEKIGKSGEGERRDIKH
jgi:hypothetical protein